MTGCEGPEGKCDRKKHNRQSDAWGPLQVTCTDPGYISGRSVCSPAASLEQPLNHR